MRLGRGAWLAAFGCAVAIHVAAAAILPRGQAHVERSAGGGGMVVGLVSLPSVASEEIEGDRDGPVDVLDEPFETVEQSAEPTEPDIVGEPAAAIEEQVTAALPPAPIPVAPEADEAPEAEVAAAVPLPVPNPLGPDRPRTEARPAPREAARPRPARSASSRDSGAVAAVRSPQRDTGAGGAAREPGGTADLTSYQGRVLAHLRRFQRYPEEARRARVQGTAQVTFRIDRDGRVIAESLARSSGHAALDAEARAMLRRASPFPAIPANAGRAEMAFTVPVTFRVR